jgi:LuxR family transcriptional regulator, maltose regulon positive regulatory protein
LTKSRIPGLEERTLTLPGGYLPRRRLDRRWSECADRRLILVTAGAGFGKSSFLIEKAEADGRPCVWCTLDERDADPAAFFAHLAEAALTPGTASRTPPGTARPDAGDRLLESLLNPLESGGHRVLFILDDAQIVAGVDPILRFLETWTRLLPDGSSLVLASREPLGIRTAKLRALGQVATLGVRDLQFDEGEVRALFRLRHPGTDLDPRLSRKIVAETEGWAAGIAILFQAAGGGSSWAIERALEQLARAGSGWFAYFAEEVVSRQTPECQQFLLRSSILPRLDPEVCDAVLGIRDSSRHLEDLAARNLFTFQAGHDPVVYRYHNLFREFLREQLARRLEPDEILRIRKRAADVLAERGLWAEAAAAYADIGDPDATLSVIEAYGEDLLAAGQYQAVRKALGDVPRSLLSKRPRALSVLGRLQEILGQWEDAGNTYRMALKCSPKGALRVELMMFLAQIHLRRGKYDAARSLCRTALRAAPPRSSKLRSAILCLLGLCSAELGRLSEAEGHLMSANQLARAGKDPINEGRSLFLLAINVHYFRGEFRKAKDAARGALLIFQKLGDQRRISHTMGVLGFLSMSTAEEREARDLTEGALRLAEALGYRMIEGYCHYTLGKCALLARDPSAAREHFETARRIGDELREPSLRTLPRMGLAETALADGNPRAARLAASEGMALARARKDRFHEALGLILVGLAGRRSASPGRSAASGPVVSWKRAERILRSMGASFELHRLILLRLDGEQLSARERMRLFAVILSGVAEHGHEFLFLSLEPERAARVLPWAIEQTVETEYVTPILLRLGSPVVPFLKPLLESPSDDVRQRAVDLLARIGGDDARVALSRAADATTKPGRAALKAARELELTPGESLRIRALGEFELRVGDGLRPREQWRSARALRLFHLLLVHRFQWVPKEMVLETLWPEGDPEKSETSLRQSILLLRKVLEPDLRETRLSRYVRFRGNAYRLDPGKGYSYDVETFEELIRAATRLRGENKARQSEGKLREAIEVYRGGFIKESPYEEFLAAERERLNDQFLRALERLLESSAALGRWQESIPLARHGLGQDPFRESFHSHLVQAQLAMGNRHEALAAYHHYEQVMKSEMGLSPSPSMRRLAERAAAMGSGPARVTPP